MKDKEIAIIGEGIAGLLLAFKLSSNGITPFVISKKNERLSASLVAQGLLGSKGIISANTELFYEKLRGQYLTEDLFFDLCRRHQEVPKYKRGCLETFSSVEEYRYLKKRIYHHKLTGLNGVTLLSKKELARHSNFLEFLELKHVKGAFYYPWDFWLEPSQFLYLLKKHLKAKGVKFLESKLLGIAQPSNSVIQVKLEDKRLTFDEVVLACGDETPSLLGEWSKDFDFLFTSGVNVSGELNESFDAVLKKGTKSFIAYGDKFKAGAVDFHGKLENGQINKAKEKLFLELKKLFGFDLNQHAKSFKFHSATRLRTKDRIPIAKAVDMGRTKKLWLLTAFYKSGYHLSHKGCEDLSRLLMKSG